MCYCVQQYLINIPHSPMLLYVLVILVHIVSEV